MESKVDSRSADGQVSDGELAFFSVELLLIAAGTTLLLRFRGTVSILFAVGALLVAVVAVAIYALRPRSEDRPAGPVYRRRTRPHRLGDYRATSHELFRIEDLREGRAVMENCLTGELVDVGLEELDALRSVRTARPIDG